MSLFYFFIVSEAKNAQFTFAEYQHEIKQFSKTILLISNLSLIRQSLQGYRCERASLIFFRKFDLSFKPFILFIGT